MRSWDSFGCGGRNVTLAVRFSKLPLFGWGEVQLCLPGSSRGHGDSSGRALYQKVFKISVADFVKVLGDEMLWWYYRCILTRQVGLMKAPSHLHCCPSSGQYA